VWHRRESNQRTGAERLDTERTDLDDTFAAVGRAAGTGETTMSERPIRVLFVCTGNSARSQMAEAMLTAYGHGDFQVFSAGIEPMAVSPYAVQVLGEMGIDWSGARSKSVAEFRNQSFDYVITVCDRARQACPVFPGEHNSLHWGLEDPADVEGTDEQKLAAFRRTQTELGGRLRPFIELARRTAKEEAPA